MKRAQDACSIIITNLFLFYCTNSFLSLIFRPHFCLCLLFLWLFFNFVEKAITFDRCASRGKEKPLKTHKNIVKNNKKVFSRFFRVFLFPHEVQKLKVCTFNQIEEEPILFQFSTSLAKASILGQVLYNYQNSLSKNTPNLFLGIWLFSPCELN